MSVRHECGEAGEGALVEEIEVFFRNHVPDIADFLLERTEDW